MNEGTTFDITPIEHLTTVSSTTETLAAMVLALLIGAFVSLVAAHLLDRGVNPISDAVSDYGARDYKMLYRLTAFWMGFAGLLTAVMLGDALYPKPTLVILLLLVFAATRGAITLFPVDLPGADETQTGRSHTVLATIAFASFALAAALLPRELSDDPFWTDHLQTMRGLGIVVFATAIGTAITHRVALKQYFGLVERLFYVAMFAWLATPCVIFLTT
ncbi:MAG: DUF998 domain-containing protein [Solirubrobacterales bacterium]